MRRIAPTSQTRPKTRPDQSGRSLLVLYVDDDKDNWEVSHLALRRRFDLLWAKNAQEAVQLITEHHERLSAILIDIELQNSLLNGIQLAQLIRGRLSEENIPSYAATLPVLRTPIFFVTAHGKRYAAEELLEVAYEVMHKPVDFAQLSLALTDLDMRQMAGPAPRVLLEALQPDVSPRQVRDLISAEPALLQRLTRLGACGVFGPLATLDLAGLRTAALCLAVAELLPGDAQPALLWAPIVRRAVAARLAGQHLDSHGPDYFGVGLLLDAGLLARARHDLRGALEIAETPAAWRTVHEGATGGVDHASRGGEIARAWQLETAIVAAVQMHHSAQPADTITARVAWLAERLAAVFESGHPQSHLATAEAAGSCVGVEPTDIRRMLDLIPALVQRCGDALGYDLGAQPSLSSLLAIQSNDLAQMHRLYENLVSTVDAVVLEKTTLARRLRRANERLAEEASHDVLTGIANRRTFDIAVARDLARADRSLTCVSLILVDLDRFKQVNDTYGHQVGDDVLRAAAKVLAQGARSHDVVSRYGGEEFALILPGVALEGAVATAERLRLAIEKMPCERPGGIVQITASFGVTTIGGPGCVQATSAFLQRADAALYRAKQRGRNRIEIEKPPSSP